MSLAKNDIIVFLGPSLPKQVAADLLLADYRPPAAQGDIYRAVKDRPKVIALIDGLFENQPAVWHKEILYAISQGIHVYGASSMGALRAAELSVYGMQGIGWIYEAFANQVLTDDDEVTITHAPEALGFQPTSEAMVNIRTSLEAATQADVIAEEQAKQLIQLSKRRWYPNRHWRTVLDDAEQLLSVEQANALNDFLAEHRIDIKQQDAKALLDTLCNLRQQDAVLPAQANFDFVHTDAWQGLVEHTEAQIATERLDIKRLQQELALQGKFENYQIEARQAKAAQTIGESLIRNNPSYLQDALTEFTQQIEATGEGNTPDLEKVQHWLADQNLTMASFDALIQRRAMQIAGTQSIADCTEQFIDATRLTGEYQQLTQRYAHKKQLLTAVGIANIALADTHLTDEQLVSWYFREYRKSPEPTSLTNYIAAQGFNDESHFLQTLLQEYLYLAALQENKQQ